MIRHYYTFYNIFNFLILSVANQSHKSSSNSSVQIIDNDKQLRDSVFEDNCERCEFFKFFTFDEKKPIGRVSLIIISSFSTIFVLIY